jgi:hypothetical protein
LLRPLLEVFPHEDALIVIGDAQHVTLNIPEDEECAKNAVDNFLPTFQQLTDQRRRAVVLSAEDTCCAPAMSHMHPSNLFADDGKRLKRTCTPGDENCQPIHNEFSRMWKESMQESARDSGSDWLHVYLNSGVLAGHKFDLLHLLDALKIEGNEDDQTVLTALARHKPDWIVLDYQQKMFGNNYISNPTNMMEGCNYERDDLMGSQLFHIEKKAQPLLLQTSGPYHAACIDFMIEQLGGVSQERYLLTSDFFDMVGNIENQEQSTNGPPTLPPPPTSEMQEDSMVAFFGAGIEEPTTSNQNYGVANASSINNYGPIGSGIGGIHNKPVNEDDVDSSGFQFPDYEPNYGYGSYGSGDRPGDNFWNYGENNPSNHVSNYGGSIDIDGRLQRPRDPNPLPRSKNT